MQLTCPINQAEAIRRGFNTSSTVKLEIDPATLSLEQRDLLASKFKSGEYQAYGDQCLPEPTVAGLLESLEQIIAWRKAEAEKAETSKQKLLARFDEDPRAMVYYNDYNNSFGLFNGLQSEWLDQPRKTVLDATVAELKRQNQQVKEEKQAEQDRQNALHAATKAAKAVEAETFRQWALAHGSETLRLRTEEGFDWRPLAEFEWADAMLAKAGITETPLPEMKDYTPDACDCTAPSAAEIKRLRKFREALQTVPEMEATVTLKSLTYTKDQDDEFSYEEPEKIGRNELKVTVNGHSRGEVRYYLA